MKFWQWSLLILFVIIGFIINLLDKKKSNLKFSYDELPHLQPIKFSTKGKGFLVSKVLLCGYYQQEIGNLQKIGNIESMVVSM